MTEREKKGLWKWLVTTTSGAIVALSVTCGGLYTMIAAPKFMRYQLRSKTSEAKTVLGGIKTSLESFRMEYDTYGHGVSMHPPVPFSETKVPWPEIPCATTCNRAEMKGCTSFECFGYRPSGPVYYRYACETVMPKPGTSPEFTCVAVGDVDGDGVKAAFLYGTGNSSTAGGKIVAPIPKLLDFKTECAVGKTPASEVVDCTPQNF